MNIGIDFENFFPEDAKAETLGLVIIHTFKKNRFDDINVIGKNLHLKDVKSITTNNKAKDSVNDKVVKS